MENKNSPYPIKEWIKSLADAIKIETSLENPNNLILHHASNSIKSLSKLQDKLEKRFKK